jgi:release factor glutamine methyltransferase
MKTLGRDRTWLYTHPEHPLDSAAAEQYLALISRRIAGEPTQYLTGKQEFWGLEFEVNSDVLIPRPETEHVVEVALERLGERGIKINMRTGLPNPTLRIADVGTGSGCIAVALAHELPHAEVIATDISASALVVARRNADRHKVSGRVHFIEANLLEKVADRGRGPFDLIVSNPPYIARTDAASLPIEVLGHEPHSALFGGLNGVEMYIRLIEQAGAQLGPGGILVLELGYNSADEVRKMFDRERRWANIRITDDLASIARVIAAERR